MGLSFRDDLVAQVNEPMERVREMHRRLDAHDERVRNGWGGFVCACGHPAGDHRSNGSYPVLEFGVCLTQGCGCREFEDPS